MKYILLLVACVLSTALAQTFPVQPAAIPITIVCPSGQATASGNTYSCPGGVIPQCPSPPGAGPCPPPTTCPGYQTVNLGDIQFGDLTRDSQGMVNGVVAYGRIVIPNPLPQGWANRTTALGVFEHGDGTAWKQLWLSKDRPCVFTNTGYNMSQGLTASVYMTFNGTGVGSVGVKAGEIWYATVRNQLPDGRTSCATGSSCNFGYLLPFPGM